MSDGGSTILAIARFAVFRRLNHEAFSFQYGLGELFVKIDDCSLNPVLQHSPNVVELPRITCSVCVSLVVEN